MRPAYPLFSRKYYTDLYYSTLTPLLSDAPTRYSFLSLRPKMTPDEHKCRGRGRERERERQVTARCNCFFFFLLVLFFSSRFFSFRFVLFLFSSVCFFFAPLFSKFTQSLHGNAKCEWRVAMRSFLLEGWWPRRDRNQTWPFFASMEHRYCCIVAFAFYVGRYFFSGSLFISIVVI